MFWRFFKSLSLIWPKLRKREIEEFENELDEEYLEEEREEDMIYLSLEDILDETRGTSKKLQVEKKKLAKSFVYNTTCTQAVFLPSS